MSDRPKHSKPATTQSGILPRLILEPEDRREAPLSHIPVADLGNTPLMNEGPPVVLEVRDNVAQRDRDRAEHNQSQQGEEEPQSSRV